MRQTTDKDGKYRTEGNAVDVRAARLLENQIASDSMCAGM
jgi:hypothetical protein